MFHLKVIITAFSREKNLENYTLDVQASAENDMSHFCSHPIGQLSHMSVSYFRVGGKEEQSYPSLENGKQSSPSLLSQCVMLCNGGGGAWSKEVREGCLDRQLKELDFNLVFDKLTSYSWLGYWDSKKDSPFSTTVHKTKT